MVSSSPASQSELIRHHLIYEINMLLATYLKFVGNDKCAKDDVIKNALIESFCVHARNLIEFLREKHRSYTDGSYHPFSAFGKDEIEKIITRLNNQISHLKLGRTTVSSDKINIIGEGTKIVNILAEELAQFKAHLTGGFKDVDIPVIRRLAVPETLSSQANTTSSISISVFGPFFPSTS